jgi:streptogramin lyase
VLTRDEVTRRFQALDRAFPWEWGEHGDGPATVGNLDGLAGFDTSKQFARPLSELTHSDACHVLVVAHDLSLCPDQGPPILPRPAPNAVTYVSFSWVTLLCSLDRHGGSLGGQPSSRLIIAALSLLLVGAGCASSERGQVLPSSTLPEATSSTPGTPSSLAPVFRDPIDVAFDRTGAMWVGNYRSSTLVRFLPEDLEGASGRSSLQPSLTLSGFHGPNQIVFDRNGMLWVASWDDNAIRAYLPTALSTSGEATATVTIRGSHLAEPTDLVFDATGALWVANQVTGEVVSYTRDDLMAGGRPRPHVVLRAFPAGTPEAVAFDLTGRLWVSDYYGDMLRAFDSSALAASGRPKPSRLLMLPDGAGPIGLTLDKRGRLWIAEAGVHAIAVFGPNPEGTADPEFTLTGDALDMPHSVTFGPDDSVWAPCYNDTVLRYDQGAVESGGAVQPAVILG